MNLKFFKTLSAASRSTWFVGLTLLTTLGGLSAPASAGNWKLDGYFYSVKARGELQQWYQGQFVHELRKTSLDETYKAVSPQNVREPFSFPLTTQLSAQRTYGASAPTPQGWPIKAGEMFAHVSVHCVFKWQRRTLLDPQTWQEYPDPTDNPPQTMFIWEDAIANCTRYHSNAGDWPDTLYSAAHPFTGDWMPLHLLRIKNNFNVQSTHSQGGYQGLIDSLVGNRLSRIETGGREVVHGPSVLLEGVLSFSDKNFPSYTEQAGIQMAFAYEARAVDFTLGGRRKGSLANTPFNADAYVAAGGVNNDEHKAEILLKMTVPDYDGRRVGIGGVPISELKEIHKLGLKLKNGEGVGSAPKMDAVSLPSTYEGVQQYDPAAVTDSSGSAIFGVVKSRDLVGDANWPYITPVVPPTSVGLSTSTTSGIMSSGYDPTPHINLYQTWSTVEWRMGENGEKPWDPNFYVSNANIQQWIWAQAMVFVNKPLKGHTMKFALKRITVRELKAGFTTIQKSIYTTDQKEADDYEANPYREPNTHAYYSPNLSTYTSDMNQNNANHYLILPENLIEDADGVYKGQVTLVANPAFEVQDYQLALEDQGVYKRTQ